MELMRSVGGDVDGGSGVGGGFLAAKGQFDFAFEENEGLFVVVAMRAGSAAERDEHVDDAEAAVGLGSGDSDRVGVADQADMREFYGSVQLGESQCPAGIVDRDGRLA